MNQLEQIEEREFMSYKTPGVSSDDLCNKGVLFTKTRINDLTGFNVIMSE